MKDISNNIAKPITENSLKPAIKCSIIDIEKNYNPQQNKQKEELKVYDEAITLNPKDIYNESELVELLLTGMLLNLKNNH